MKKILTILFLLLLSINIQAQIQRTFWGLELGRSTKEEVKSLLFSKNLEFDDYFDGRNAICTLGSKNELDFGGYGWSVVFEFYDNRLYFIQMLKLPYNLSTTTGETYEIDTKFIFHELRGKLTNKYSNLEKVPIENASSHYAIRDNNTVVDLILDNKNVILRYYDRKLTRMKQSGTDL